LKEQMREFIKNKKPKGQKGQSYLDSGFIYAPYIPVQKMRTITDAEEY
jgi:hypothetical protein